MTKRCPRCGTPAEPGVPTVGTNQPRMYCPNRKCPTVDFPEVLALVLENFTPDAIAARLRSRPTSSPWHDDGTECEYETTLVDLVVDPELDPACCSCGHRLSERHDAARARAG